jgi:hypothetical protein
VYSSLVVYLSTVAVHTLAFMHSPRVPCAVCRVLSHPQLHLLFRTPAFMQYPRCMNSTLAASPPFLATEDPCYKHPPNEFTHMGYSMRTLDYRYTEVSSTATRDRLCATCKSTTNFDPGLTMLTMPYTASLCRTLASTAAVGGVEVHRPFCLHQ